MVLIGFIAAKLIFLEERHYCDDSLKLASCFYRKPVSIRRPWQRLYTKNKRWEELRTLGCFPCHLFM